MRLIRKRDNRELSKRFIGDLMAMLMIVSFLPAVLAANEQYQQYTTEDLEGISLSITPTDVEAGRNYMIKAQLDPALEGIIVHFESEGIASEFYETEVHTIAGGAAYTTWIPDQAGEAVIKASATVNGVTKETYITVQAEAAQWTLKDRFNLDYDMDFYIFSPERWLGRNIHWNDPALTILDMNERNVADKAFSVTFEDWIDHSYDDVKFKLDASGNKIEITKEAVNTACPDRTHLVLHFDEPKTVKVQYIGKPAVSVKDTEEVYTGTDHDLLLWNHVVYDTWTKATITISDVQEEPSMEPDMDIVSLSPSYRTAQPGEYVQYTMVVKDLRPNYPTYDTAAEKYDLSLQGVSFKHTLPASVTLTPGEQKTIIFGISIGTVAHTPVEYLVKVVASQTRNEGKVPYSVFMDTAESRLRIVQETEPANIKMSILPASQRVNAGEQAHYTVRVQDTRPVTRCVQTETISPTDSADDAVKMIARCVQPTQEYRLTLEGLPYEYKMEQRFFLAAGETKTLDLWVDTDDEHKLGTYDFRIIASRQLKSTSEYAASATAKLRVDKEVIPPASDVVVLKLEKGWNLVSLPGSLKYFEPGVESKLLGFVWMEDTNSYVSMRTARDKLGSKFNTYLAKYAFWIYSYQEQEVRVHVKDDDNQVSLKTGWNLVPVRDYFIGQTIVSMLDGCIVPIVHEQGQERIEVYQGCGVESIYSWNAEEQKWEKMSIYTHFNNGPRINHIGTGFIMKMNRPAMLVKDYSVPDFPEE